MINATKDRPENNDDSLKNLYIFQDLFAFSRDHTGLTFTIAYLTLILSSMIYLHVLYSAFDIDIVKFLSLEDILATPIKNPDIIFVFLTIILVLFMSELGNRWNVRSREKYKNKKPPFIVKLARIAVWVPKSRRTNIQFTLFTSIAFFATYIVMFAKFEAEAIKEGKGARYQITLADTEQPIQQTLLGTTNQFIFIYDLNSHESGIYHIENVLQMQPDLTKTSKIIESEPATLEEDTIVTDTKQKPEAN